MLDVSKAFAAEVLLTSRIQHLLITCHLSHITLRVIFCHPDSRVPA